MTENEIRQADFVDRMGLLFVRSGSSNTMGRILGFLLVCDPPEQSLAQIGLALGVSKGATSQITRQLEQMALIERVPGGGRSTIYRMRRRAWAASMREQLALTNLFIDLTDAGLASIDEPDGPGGDRLRDLRDFYSAFDVELRAFMKRYDETLARRGDP